MSSAQQSVHRPVTQAVAARLGLDLRFVNFPGHVLLHVEESELRPQGSQPPRDASASASSAASSSSSSSAAAAASSSSSPSAISGPHGAPSPPDSPGPAFYLDPAASGRRLSPAAVHHALRQLGMHEADDAAWLSAVTLDPSL